MLEHDSNLQLKDNLASSELFFQICEENRKYVLCKANFQNC